MATYVPNANQTAEPVESQPVESAALEFRTLKKHALQFLTADADASKTTLPAATARAGKFLAFDSVTGGPVIGPDIADWTITQSQIAAVETVAADLNEPGSEIETVAASIANVDLVGPSISSVNTVAPSIGDVVIVADSIAAVNNLSDAVTNGDLLTGVYQGAYAANPIKRLDASDLQNGDIYFNTATNRMMAYANGTWYATETEGATDASLVSYTEDVASATSMAVSERLNRNRLYGVQRNTPRQIANKMMLANSGTATTLKVMMFGDSLAHRKANALFSHLSSAIFGFAPGYNFSNYFSSQTAFSIQSGTFTSDPADGFTYWPTKQLNKLTSTSSVKWWNTSFSINYVFTKLKFFYIKEPTAGVFKIRVNSVDLVTIDAYAASVGVGSYEIVQAHGASLVETIGVSGGDVRIIDGLITEAAAPGHVCGWAVAMGGQSLATAMASSQCREIFRQAMLDYGLELCTFEMDDVFATADLDAYADILDSAAPVADKIFIATTPKSSDSTPLRRDQLEALCYGRDYSYFFFDGWTPVAPYSTLVSLGWQGDGTHPSDTCSAYLSGLLIESLGLLNSVFGNVAKPTASTKPSLLGNNTKFGIPTAADNVYASLSTDSNGYLAYMKSKYAINLSTAAGATLMQVSGVGSWPNVFPLTTDFGTSGDVRKRSVIGATVNSPEWTVWQKTDNPGGRMNMIMGIINSSMTKAQILTYAANSNIGALVFCSDAAGGAAWVYARGTSPGDWVKVDGNAAI